MPSDQYTILVSGQNFVFTRDQLESEPGNYFATYFLGDFQEASNGTRELNLEKDPLIFKLIQSHLRGYAIFPITDASIPKEMSRENALKNLHRDADYFGLQSLVEMVHAEIQTDKQRPKNHGRRVYRMWSHKPKDVDERNVDGSRKAVPLSEEGYKQFSKAHEQVLSRCKYCWDISIGWELIVLLRERDKEVTTRRHYVIETRLV